MLARMCSCFVFNFFYINYHLIKTRSYAFTSPFFFIKLLYISFSLLSLYTIYVSFICNRLYTLSFFDYHDSHHYHYMARCDLSAGYVFVIQTFLLMPAGCVGIYYMYKRYGQQVRFKPHTRPTTLFTPYYTRHFSSLWSSSYTCC